jgi:hypothetical protein
MTAVGLPRGAIDVHVHAAPDVRDRPLDDIGLAERCRDAGMAGAVLKSHVEPTAGRAYLASRAVPGVVMYGGIALNRPVGGLNADAVDAMARGADGRGRIVWLPTRDAEHERAGKGRPGATVPVTAGGRPVPELGPVLEAVAAHDLVLASGHVAKGEAAAVFRLAREAGCRRLLVTHATAPISDWSTDELREIVRVGADVELSVRNLFADGPDGAKVVDAAKAERIAAAVRALGAGACVLSTDLGDARYPLPDEGLAAGVRALAAAGLPEETLAALLVARPREVLGIG